MPSLQKAPLIWANNWFKYDYNMKCDEFKDLISGAWVFKIIPCSFSPLILISKWLAGKEALPIQMRLSFKPLHLVEGSLKISDITAQTHIDHKTNSLICSVFIYKYSSSSLLSVICLFVKYTKWLQQFPQETYLILTVPFLLSNYAVGVDLDISDVSLWVTKPT